MKRVAVLGAGLAGIAAAWAAQRAGARVRIYDGGAGASRLTSGALDTRWSTDELPLSMTAELRAFLDALGHVVVPEQPCLLATGAGVLRIARGADASLLDLAPLAGKTVAVAATQRSDLDAHALARALSFEPAAQQRAIRVVAVRIDTLRFDDERYLPAIDFAALHDDETRLRWLADRIADARRAEPFDALLLGTWLGASTPRAPMLSSLLGLPVGETLSGPGSTAGRRLGMALRALRERTQLETLQTQALTREGPKGVWHVDASGREEPFDAVVLATGGVAAGGITLERASPDDVATTPPRFVMPALESAPLRWSAPVAGSPSTSLPQLAWSLCEPGVLERIGVLHRNGQVLDDRGQERPGLFVAGDAALGLARTWLAAASSGLEAGRAAAR